MIAHRKVLVLNKWWTACGVVTIRRAISLLFKGLATIIDPQKQFQTFTWADWEETQPAPGEDCITSPRRSFRVPEVILLAKYDKLPSRQQVNFNRHSLLRRDGHVCQYCGESPNVKSLTVDHVVPKCQGGRTSWDNCVAACRPCNARKADRTPEQAGMTLRSTPAKPRFNFFRTDRRLQSWEHFLGENY